MAKTKKKKNYRLRKSVRRTLGALFMISAIIVAAIPFPDAAATNGDTNQNEGRNSSSSSELVYSVTNDTDINAGDDAVDLDPTGKTIQYSYGVYEVSGQWIYQWQFGFYDAGNDSSGAAGDKIGIISKYNDEYKVSDITLKNTINTGYITVEYEDYANYFDGTVERVMEYKDKENANLRTEFQKYFKNTLDAFDSKVKTYEDWLAKNSNATPEERAAEEAKVIVKAKPSDLENDDRSRYYCDYVIKSDRADNDFFLRGLDFKMVAVDAYVREKPYCTMYIPQATKPSSTTAPAGYEIDKYGFIYPKDTACKLKGIGNEAFKGITSVDILNLPENISYIGNNAFEKSFVRDVTIAYVSEIGNAAFKGCALLESVDIQNQTTVIGTEAFAKTKISNLSLPYSVIKIGQGAFADNEYLTTIVFPPNSNGDVEICNFAFYNCPNLSSIDLSEKKSITSIGKGAFALDVSTEDGLTCTSFSFPSGISDATKLGDYILSNRTTLKDVIMPSALGSRMPSDNDTDKITIPSNTFKGCNGLGSVTFPDKNESGACGYVVFDETLFDDVTNRSFYVAGPGTNYRDEIASPRKSTWKCSNAYDEAIPYVYTLNGKEVFEVSQVDETDSDKSYLMSVDANGILQSCNFTDSKPPLGIIDEADSFTIEKLVIPGTIAGLSVKGLAKGCFTQPYDGFIDKIEELVISDGGELAEIDAGVFKGAMLLKKVYIGDSIQKIGAEAFMDCKALKEIEFSKPKNGKTELGANALKTNGNCLTVIGVIEEGYSPFEWAMDPQNYVNNDGVRVLYKSPAPQSLSVILDNRNNLVTLVDYPHYGDLKEYKESPNDTPIDLTKIYENIIFNNEGELTLAQEALVNATLKIEIPAGIESIDVQGYLNNSSKTFDGVEPKTNNQSISKYFDVTDERFSSYMTYGLFNGNSADASSGSEMADETKEIGNDCIQEIVMHTVKYLPNTQTKSRSTSDDVLAANGISTGAFYSCEDLKTVILGDAMEDIGELPFLGCYNLNSVTSNSKNTNGATKYVCQNKIIYENKDDGTVEIVECLGSRGNSQDSEVSVTIDNKDPGLKDVSSIAEGAFSNCPNLKIVDFRGNSTLKELPANAFYDSDSLIRVDLPENMRTIGQHAFSNINPARPNVYIYGKEVSLAHNAFENTDATVHTYKDSSAYNTAAGLLGSEQQGGVVALPEGTPVYEVKFFDYDFKTQIGTTQEVEHGKFASAPAEPSRDGYTFKGWSNTEWLNDGKNTTGVTRNLDVYAMYEPNTSTNNNNNSNNNNSNNNSNNSNNNNSNNKDENKDAIKGDYVDGGIDTNNDGIPDVDEKGNKLYKLTVTNGEGSGYYKAGKTVNIKAGIAPKGTSFAYWSCSNNNLIFQDHTDWITTLTMVAEDVTVICNFDGQYRLEVEYGTGSGSYPAGAKVAISALEAPEGREFANWTTKTNGLNIEDSTKATTIITMPQGNALITATYKDTPKKGTVSSNTTSPSKNNTSVVITKPGISDKNSASAYVSGSSDNFVVKISESLDAADEVQRALQKKYPDMSRIKYFAMDISLYDAKGENKITNTDGLKVNVTMPIPDALREYAGNNRVGAVKNGELETLNPKFTTINGVPSVTFTATHFSPYTIYVDTGNMTAAGTLDSTPKTGDGIHPKWFLSLGLACISIILFTKRDKKYVVKA